MNCKNCGEQNATGAKFCNNCGSLLEHAEEEPLKSEENQIGRKPPMSNKNKAVAIALGIAGILAVVLFALILFMMNAKSVEGKWYSPALGQVMEFRKNDEVIVYTSMGAYLGSYTYDDKKGTGEIEFPGVVYSFVSDGENVTVYDQNGTPAVYLKMDDSMDAESMIMLQNETAEPTNTQNDITPEPQTTEAATESPTPTTQPSTTPPIATVGSTATPTNTPAPTNTPTPTPTLIPIVTPTPMATLHFSFLPIPLYTIAPYQEIAGKFYSVSGEDGIFEFGDSYRYSYDINGGGVLFTTGDFTYNNVSNQGNLHPDYTLLSIPFSYNATTEILTVQGIEYTRTYVPQS